jgi:hypothetical protein
MPTVTHTFTHLETQKSHTHLTNLCTCHITYVPPFSHSHIYTHSHSKIISNTYTHKYALTSLYTYKHKHTHTQMPTHLHTPIHTLKSTHTFTLTHIWTYTYTQMHAYKHNTPTHNAKHSIVHITHQHTQKPLHKIIHIHTPLDTSTHTPAYTLTQ